MVFIGALLLGLVVFVSSTPSLKPPPTLGHRFKNHLDHTSEKVNSNHEEIDDGLYSRQVYVLGKEAQQKLQGSRVLIIGMSGIGVEIAKNLALAGISEIHLYDPKLCQFSDLSNNYYINMSNIHSKVTRVEAVLPHLTSLNPYSHITNKNKHCSSSSGENKEGRCTYSSMTKLISEGNYKCVVTADQPQHIEKNINKIVRSQNNNTSFVSCGGCGVFGNIFCDLGELFEVSDPTGNEQKFLPIEEFSLFKQFQPDESTQNVSIKSNLEISNTQANDSGSLIRYVALACTVGTGNEKHGLVAGNRVLLQDIQWHSDEENPNIEFGDISTIMNKNFKTLSGKVIEAKNPYSVTLLIEDIDGEAMKSLPNTNGINSSYVKNGVDKNFMKSVKVTKNRVAFKSGVMTRPKEDERYQLGFKPLDSFVGSKFKPLLEKKHIQSKKVENKHNQSVENLVKTGSNRKKAAVSSESLPSHHDTAAKTAQPPSFFTSLFGRKRKWTTKLSTSSSSSSSSSSSDDEKDSLLNKWLDQVPIVPCDWGKIDTLRTATIHAIWRYVIPLLYKQKYSLKNEELTCLECQELVKRFIGSKGDEHVCRAFAHCYSARLKLNHYTSSSSSSAEKIEKGTCLISQEFDTEHVTLAPVAYFIGAVASQEVLKAVSGVFNPIHQFLYFDAIELLDGEDLNMKKKTSKHVKRGKLKSLEHDKIVVLKGDRYDAQRLILGDQTCDLLKEKNWFLVGAGAIGCELLKNAAMLGMCCDNHNINADSQTTPSSSSAAATLSTDEKNNTENMFKDERKVSMGGFSNKCEGLIVTDMDTIERSNLNRQFFFRSHNIGDYKSSVACQAAHSMNPDLKLKPITSPVNAETCATGSFNDHFWSRLDGVWTALDNIESRLFIDEKCVKHKLPLIDAGTLGAKGNVQVVVPYVTESYGESSDPSEDNEDIPVCTVKSYPYRAEHTVQWSRELFDEMFVKLPNTIKKLVDSYQASRHGKYFDVTDLLNEELQEELQDVSYLSKVNEYLSIVAQASYMMSLSEKNSTEGNNRSGSGSDTGGLNDALSTLADKCFEWAVSSLLINQFKIPIDIQRKEHAEDSLDEESGLPFWTGNRKRPIAFELNHESKYQVDVVLSSARLLCQALIGRALTPVEKKHYFSELDAIGFIQQTEYNLWDDSLTEQTVRNNREGNHHSMVQELQRLLVSYQAIGNGVTALEFEKDDESNGQIDFIASASNMRNMLYGIQPIETLQVKKIAGRILPAIATTTSAVAALSAIEMIKIVQSMPSLSSFSSSQNKKKSLLKSKIGLFKNSFMNLAVPLFAFSEPVRTPEFLLGKAQPMKTFTSWDVFHINPGNEDISLKCFVERVETAAGRGCFVKSIVTNGTIIVSDVFELLKNEEKEVGRSPVEKAALQKEVEGNILVENIVDNPHGEKDITSFKQIILKSQQGETPYPPTWNSFIDLEVLLEDGQGEMLDFPAVRFFMPLI